MTKSKDKAYGGFHNETLLGIKRGILREIQQGGLTLCVEFKPDEIRHGNHMICGYGYIKGTMGADKMPTDCYIHKDVFDDSIFTGFRTTYVVNQMDKHGYLFDEYKVMVGFPNRESARKAYTYIMGEVRYGGIFELEDPDSIDYRKLYS